ncbi:NADH-quinone oxidoreductase subunit C [Streptomyces zhihengii]|uniref:NADH-quinone oxidoreductase subunit C n=1 Tax=Streptomyces zhihengii TaxID=1818004 RepID=UPI003451D447
MNAYDRLPDAVTEIFGPDATAERGYELLTVDVPAASWTTALETARTTLGCTYFDWLSAVDEPGTGFRVCAHLVALADGAVRRLLVRTTVPHDAPALPTAVGVYAGAGWHERETHEMFGISFTGHPHLDPLLLPDGFEGHPLRKDFVLAARVAKAWPGAKEPGEAAAGHDGPKRRQMLPPGVPDPNEWGPLKGQLPPAPSRPARTPRTAAATTPGERPPRRTRSVSEGSASQAAAPAAPPRRSRSASEGSASQSSPAAPPRRTRSAAEGSASQAAPPAAPASPAPASPAPADRPRSSDAPWHHARPAFDTPPPRPAEGDGTADGTPAEGPARPAPAPAGGTEPTGATPAERAAPTEAPPTEATRAGGGDAPAGDAARPAAPAPAGAAEPTEAAPAEGAGPTEGTPTGATRAEDAARPAAPAPAGGAESTGGAAPSDGTPASTAPAGAADPAEGDPSEDAAPAEGTPAEGTAPAEDADPAEGTGRPTATDHTPTDRTGGDPA